MEDVWSEVSLSSIIHRSTADSAFRSQPLPPLRLQAFLDCPDPSKPQTKNLLLEITGQNRGSGAERVVPNPAIDEQANSRKRIRLMKNRESAVRSRARKQAYTYELELEVARLLKENANLRKHLEEAGDEQTKSEQVCKEATGEQLKKKNKKKNQLQRTASAPF